MSRADVSEPTLSLVVPTYNERERLPALVDEVCRVWREHGIAGEIVVVDDNSPDGTAAIAEALGRTHPVRLLVRPAKLGLGSAVVAGFGVARGRVLGVMDADLSHPPELLPRMLDALDRGSDFVVASRYIRGGQTGRWPLKRRLLSQLACVLARPLTEVRDATSGFFLLQRHVVEDVVIVAGGFKICLELLVRGHATSVVEVPYGFADRTAGASKMNAIEAFDYLRQLRQLMGWRARHRSRPCYRQEGP